MADLQNPRLIYLKGFLFLAIVACSCAMLFLSAPSWQTGVLLVLVIWGSARAYYFMFYVIEKYVDSRYRFSGVISFVKYMLHERARDDRDFNSPS